MKNFQLSRGSRNIMHSRPVLVLLFILVLVFAWSVFGFMGKMGTAKENKKIAENKVAQLEKEREKLSSDIAKLETEEGIEESIREKFGLVKEGENMIVITEDKSDSVAEKASSGNFFSFLKNWLWP